MSALYHGCVRKCQGSVRIVSGWRQNDVRKTSGKHQDGVEMASGNIKIGQSRQEGIRMRQDGVKMALG